MYLCVRFFFLNGTATTEIYTLSLHDALPILDERRLAGGVLDVAALGVDQPDVLRARREEREDLVAVEALHAVDVRRLGDADRKSTRLNSSHSQISYAVFCLKKKI